MKAVGKGRVYFILILLITTAAIGCIEDKCAGITCLNEGVCVQGTCACLQGYEGEKCDVDWHEKFKGKWSVQEFDRRGNLLTQYRLETIPASAPDTFYLLGLTGEIDTVMCARKAYRGFTMLAKEVSDSLSLQSGEATMDETTGNVTGLYSITKADISTTVNFTWEQE